MSARCLLPSRLIIECMPLLRECTATAWQVPLTNPAGVELMGVAPDQEQKVTVLHTRIVKGSYLNEGMPKGIVIGDKLATTIGVGVGSEIALLVQAADGSMGNDLYAVAGIFHTGLEPMDRGLVLMSLPSLQELLHLAPGRIHEVGIKLHDATDAVAVAGTLEAQLGKTLPVRVQALA